MKALERLEGHVLLQRIADAVMKQEENGYCPFCTRDESEGFMRDEHPRGHVRGCPTGAYVREMRKKNPQATLLRNAR